MSMIGFARLATVAASLVAFSAGLSAQSKVGIVNLQKALQDADEVKDAQSKIEANFKPRSERIAGMEKDMAKLQQEYDQNQSKYTPAALEELANNIQRRQVQMQRLQQSFQDDFNRDRTDLLTKFGTRMQDVLKKLAEDKGLDMIIDVTNLLYYKPAIDLSTEATAAYNKAFPLKK
jgi:outer membrane protein